MAASILALVPNELGKGGDALAQIALEPVQLPDPGLARAIDRRFQAARDVPAH